MGCGPSVACVALCAWISKKRARHHRPELDIDSGSLHHNNIKLGEVQSFE